MKKIKEKKFVLRFFYTLLAAAIWIGVWQLAAVVTDNTLLFAKPLDVIKRFLELASALDFYKTVFFSMLRVISGSIAAVLCGIVIAVLTSKFEAVNILIKPLMTVIKSTPVASFIILALVWLSRSKLPIFIVFLIVLPVVWTNVHTGIKNMDKKLVEMAGVFRISPWRKLMMLYIPSVMPYFSSSLITSVGLAWKAGIAAEVLATPVLSIGRMLFESKQYMETLDLFAWTLTVIIMSLIIESLLLTLSKRLFMPRHTEGGKTDD